MMTTKNRQNIFSTLRVCAMIWLVGLSASLSAQSGVVSNNSTGVNSWALKMFTKTATDRSYDFGNIALHAEAEHRFVFENIFQEDVEILSVQSNCSCTSATYSKRVIKSKEKGEIIARVDTSGKVHTGQRKVTIKVQFNRPQFAEVQFQISAMIRSDVMIDPGVIEFGGVAQGERLSRTVHLQYTGTKRDWKLQSLNKTDPGIRAEAKEIAHANGRKTYEVTVSVKETAEPGYVNDLIRFQTNDTTGNAGGLFLPVRALVMAPLTAKPSFFQLGIVHPGELVSKNLVIRGSTPFKIERITSTDSRMTFLTANQESVVHVIPVTFRANGPAEEINQQIIVKTSQPDMPELEISVFGFIREKEAPNRPESALDTSPQSRPPIVAEQPNPQANSEIPAITLSPLDSASSRTIEQADNESAPAGLAHSGGRSAAKRPSAGQLLPPRPAALAATPIAPMPEKTSEPVGEMTFPELTLAKEATKENKSPHHPEAAKEADKTVEIVVAKPEPIPLDGWIPAPNPSDMVNRIDSGRWTPNELASGGLVQGESPRGESSAANSPLGGIDIVGIGTKRISTAGIADVSRGEEKRLVTENPHHPVLKENGTENGPILFRKPTLVATRPTSTPSPTLSSETRTNPPASQSSRLLPLGAENSQKEILRPPNTPQPSAPLSLGEAPQKDSASEKIPELTLPTLF